LERIMASTLVGRGVRALARAPISLFRAGYGFLFGHRLLLIEHTGRRSGLPRHVVLEVVRRLPDDRYVVPSGTGSGADWYRNVRRNPHVRIWVASRKGVPAVARTLGTTEARDHLVAYRDEHRLTWAMLRRLLVRLTGMTGRSDDELFAAIPLIELRPDR
jgi:deazaflavin-dependent oxidoreductase (nitroreductase family)